MNISMTSVQTRNVSLPAAKNHSFNQRYQMAMESFRERGYNIGSSRGFKDIGQDHVQYESYKDEMFGDIANEEVRQNMVTLMDHARDVSCYGEEQITDESGSVGNVTTFAYLNGPVIRAIWARSIVQAVMKVVPLKQPSYTATFDIPYMISDGGRKNLPYDLVDSEEPLINLKKLTPRVAAGSHIAADGSINFTNNTVKGNLLTESLLDSFGEYDGYAVDRRVAIKNIRYANYDVALSALGAPVTLAKIVKGSSKTGKAGEFVFILDLDIETATGEDTARVTVTLDCSTGRYYGYSSSDQVLGFEFDANLSSEDNRTPIQLKTEQHSIEVAIGVGQHVMIDTPVELLQDYTAAHQGSDFVVAMTDIASETFAGNMNLELLSFLRKSAEASAASQYIPPDVLRGTNKNNVEFDIRVSYGDNPTAYVDRQLKKCIGYHINDIQSVSRIEDGFWSVIGHANNVALIPDFTTQCFGQTLGETAEDESREVMGFKVGYTFGFATNVINGKVRCLYTPEVKKTSGLIGFFTSTDERRPTYLMHPYSYTVSRGYQNPVNTTLPSVMITKRHSFEEFIPMQFRLAISGNDDNQFKAPKGVAIVG